MGAAATKPTLPGPDLPSSAFHPPPTMVNPWSPLALVAVPVPLEHRSGQLPLAAVVRLHSRA